MIMETTSTLTNKLLRLELSHRILTLSCRTQGCFTVRFGNLAFTYGSRFVDFVIDRKAKEPKVRIIAAEDSLTGSDMARIIVPPWLCMAEHYPLFEKEVCFLLRIGQVQEYNVLPITSLPVQLYREFLEHGSLRLDQDFHPVLRKRSAFCEIIKVDRDNVIAFYHRGKLIKRFVTHFEPRIPRGRRE